MKVDIYHDEMYAAYLNEEKGGDYEMSWYKVLFCMIAEWMFNVAQSMLSEATYPSHDAAVKARAKETRDALEEEAVAFCYECDNTKRIIIKGPGFSSSSPCPHCSQEN